MPSLGWLPTSASSLATALLSLSLPLPLSLSLSLSPFALKNLEAALESHCINFLALALILSYPHLLLLSLFAQGVSVTAL
jgi:hypothetical protein